jgi:hypothetical protein
MKGTDVVDRAAQVVVVVASAWFFFAAAWGLFGILGDGHLGAGVAANAMCGESALRWRILYPTMDWYSSVPPQKSAYYCHHPFGQNYLPALFIWVFGHRDFAVRLPEVAMSAAIPPLLYGIAKERWGAAIGAVAAAAYVVVPIAVGFASYLNLETFCIFGSLLFFWGHSRHMTTGREKYLWASMGGMAFACFGDWVGYLIVAPTLAWSFLRAFVLPSRLTPSFDVRPYVRWWALSVAVFFVTLFGWIALFYRADAIRDWLGSAIARGGAESMPLRATLAARKAWIYFSFTPLAIKIGIAAAPLCVLRLFVTRTDEETYAPSILFAAVVQYVKFKGGADVHIFWPHYFAPYFALATAELAHAIGACAAFVVRRFAPSRSRVVAAATGLAIGLMPSLAMAHDGVNSLWVWRRTGGRYNDNGSIIESRVDFLSVMEQVVLPQTKPGMTVDVHPSLGWYWDHIWKLHGNANTSLRPLAGAGAAVAAHPFWLARPRGLGGDEEQKIAAAAHVRVYGDAWVVDQREPPAPLDAYSLNEREPNIFEWLVYGGTEPMRSVGHSPDPWLTWEWRTHLGQDAPLPMGQPTTLDEVRIAHNVAIARGDAAGAAGLQQNIERQLDRSHAAAFNRGVRLLGVRLVEGVEPRVESWFECIGLMTEATFNVRSTVEARGRFSLIPPDPTDREMAFPPPLSTKLWRAGMIYTTSAVLNHRIGRERYWGYWTSRDGKPAPARTDGALETTLVLVP